MSSTHSWPVELQQNNLCDGEPRPPTVEDFVQNMVLQRPQHCTFCSLVLRRHSFRGSSPRGLRMRLTVCVSQSSIRTRRSFSWEVYDLQTDSYCSPVRLHGFEWRNRRERKQGWRCDHCRNRNGEMACTYEIVEHSVACLVCVCELGRMCAQDLHKHP